MALEGCAAVTAGACVDVFGFVVFGAGGDGGGDFGFEFPGAGRLAAVPEAGGDGFAGDVEVEGCCVEEEEAERERSQQTMG
jgi:hypothetical protein